MGGGIFVISGSVRRSALVPRISQIGIQRRERGILDRMRRIQTHEDAQNGVAGTQDLHSVRCLSGAERGKKTPPPPLTPFGDSSQRSSELPKSQPPI